jgi:hypothetical protein
MSLLRSKILLTAIILVFGGLTAANAQIAAGSSVRGSIPLSFVVNGKTFSPGHYTISRVSQYGDTGRGEMMIRSDNGASAVFSTNSTSDNRDAAATVLTFDNVDGQYYLSGMSIKGQNQGVKVITGTRVRQMIARNRSTNTMVVTTTGE